MNTKTYAFTPANDLAKIIEAAIITKADGIAILQARKERKLAKAKPFGGKSASLLATLLGIAPRPHAQAEAIVAKVDAAPATPEEIAKLMSDSEAQIFAKCNVGPADMPVEAYVPDVETPVPNISGGGSGEQEYYAAQCKGFSKKQIAHKLRVVHLPWKKELLLAQEAQNAIDDEVDASLNIVAVNDTDAAYSLINAIRTLKPELTEAQVGDAVRAIMDA